MATWQAAVAFGTFVGVIALLMTEWEHLTFAALLAALFLIVTNVLTLFEAIGYVERSHATLALFFGVMVRAFEPTKKIFDYLAAKMVVLAGGRGDCLLLGIVAMVTPI